MEQGPTALAVVAGRVCLDIFLSSIIFLSPSLWETARYRLKYCLKRPLSPRQPTNHFIFFCNQVRGLVWSPFLRDTNNAFTRKKKNNIFSFSRISGKLSASNDT